LYLFNFIPREALDTAPNQIWGVFNAIILRILEEIGHTPIIQLIPRRILLSTSLHRSCNDVSAINRVRDLKLARVSQAATSIGTTAEQN
jgi:hypothetical protein